MGGLALGPLGLENPHTHTLIQDGLRCVCVYVGERETDREGLQHILLMQDGEIEKGERRG